MDQLGYKEEDLRVGGVMDISPKSRMINIAIPSYKFQNGANFSSTWKQIVDMKVDVAATNTELKDTDIELNLDVAHLTLLLR